MFIGGEQEINMGKCSLFVCDTRWGVRVVSEEKRIMCNSHARRLVLLAISESTHYYFAVMQCILISNAINVNGLTTSFQKLEYVTLVSFSSMICLIGLF